MKREYIKKDGTKVSYDYDYKEKFKKYNKKSREKHGDLIKLQQKKSYYKSIGDLEKVRTLELMIAVEKRRIEMNRTKD